MNSMKMIPKINSVFRILMFLIEQKRLTSNLQILKTEDCFSVKLIFEDNETEKSTEYKIHLMS